MAKAKRFEDDLIEAGRWDWFEEHRLIVTEARDAALEEAAQVYVVRAAALRASAEEAGNEKLRIERHEYAEQWESEARTIRALKAKVTPMLTSNERKQSCPSCPHQVSDHALGFVTNPCLKCECQGEA